MKSSEFCFVGCGCSLPVYDDDATVTLYSFASSVLGLV